MKKLDATVKKETLFISAITFILCVLMQSVFLISGAWDLKVLYGTLLGFSASVLNFLLMGYTVQTAVLKEEKDAKSLMKLSPKKVDNLLTRAKSALRTTLTREGGFSL